MSTSMRSMERLSSRALTMASGCQFKYIAAWMRFTPRMPMASACWRLSRSHIATCNKMSLGSEPGSLWKRMPIQPWVSSLRWKLLAATVVAKAKNLVVAPR